MEDMWKQVTEIFVQFSAFKSSRHLQNSGTVHVDRNENYYIYQGFRVPGWYRNGKDERKTNFTLENTMKAQWGVDVWCAIGRFVYQAHWATQYKGKLHTQT
jgi:hypothetical protein